MKSQREKEKKETRIPKTRNAKSKSPEPLRKVQEADEIQEEIIQEAPEKEEDSTTDKVSEMEEHEERIQGDVVERDLNGFLNQLMQMMEQNKSDAIQRQAEFETRVEQRMNEVFNKIEIEKD